MPDFTTLTKEQIVEILGSHDGSKAEVARRASVDNSLVSKWLSGTSVSANVARHAEEHARELIEADRLAKGEANGPSARKLLNDVLTKGVDAPEVAPIIEKLKKAPHSEE